MTTTEPDAIALMVAPDELRAVLPFAEPLIQRALDHGVPGWDLADAVAALMAGHWQLWVSMRPGRLDLAVLTSFEDRPRLRVLRVNAVAGDRLAEDGPALWQQIRAWAFNMGARHVQAEARRGWMRSAHRAVFGLGATHDLLSFPLQLDEEG